MNYYITGASGFIGTAMCRHLATPGNVIFKAGREMDAYQLRHADIIINLAAYGNHYDQTDIGKTLKANILDLQEMLGFVKRCDFIKMYNISTSSVTLPKQTVYSASKLIGEALVNACNDKRMVNVRPYSVYGEGEASHRFIPTVIRCLQSGEVMELCDAVHDWIYVDDFINAMFAGNTEIGSGAQTTNLQVVRLLERISGKILSYKSKPGLRSYDTYDWHCAVPVKCRPLYEGLKQTYDILTQ